MNQTILFLILFNLLIRLLQKYFLRVTNRKNQKLLLCQGYNFVSRMNGKVLEFHPGITNDYKNGILVTWDDTGCANQHFNLERCKDKRHYIIRSKLQQHKVLDVEEGKQNDGTQIILYQYHGNTNQLWIFQSVIENNKPTQFIRIINNHMNKVLQILGGIDANRITLHQTHTIIIKIINGNQFEQINSQAKNPFDTIDTQTKMLFI